LILEVLLLWPLGRCGPAAPTLAEMFKPRMKAKEHEWERRGDRGLLIVDRRISRFFMWLEHLASVRPWSVPLHVLHSQRIRRF
jgi:hypothetical protein